MIDVVQSDLATRRERHSKHSAYRTQDDGPNHQTHDDDHLIGNNKHSHWMQMQRVAQYLRLHEILENEVHDLRCTER